MKPDELRALQEQAHQLQELTKHPGWAVLEDYAVRSPFGTATRQTGLLNGGAKSYDDYQKQTGWLSGVYFVLHAPQRVRELADDKSAKARDGA